MPAASPETEGSVTVTGDHQPRDRGERVCSAEMCRVSEPIGVPNVWKMPSRPRLAIDDADT